MDNISDLQTENLQKDFLNLVFVTAIPTRLAEGYKIIIIEQKLIIL